MKCGCGNKADRGRYCFACLTRRQRKRDKIKASYQILKDNAKRRGKPFSLTFDQFRKFATETQYIAKKGRTATSYHIDRISEAGGYTLDNIQVLTNSANVKKYLKFKERNQDGSASFTVIQDVPKNYPDVPF